MNRRSNNFLTAGLVFWLLAFCSGVAVARMAAYCAAGIVHRHEAEQAEVGLDLYTGGQQ